MPAMDEAGHSLFISSMSNELGTSVPVLIDSSYLKGSFSSLVPTIQCGHFLPSYGLGGAGYYSRTHPS